MTSYRNTLRSPATVTFASDSGRVLLELGLDARLRMRADDLVDDLSALEEQEHRDRADVEARGRLAVRIDVELRDLHLPRIFLRELVERRRDLAARSAPGGPEVHHDQPVLLLDFSLEVRVRNLRRLRHRSDFLRS